nr:MAG TPA: hypothetical protein [Caudoviricetes sp.]
MHIFYYKNIKIMVFFVLLYSFCSCVCDTI